MLKLFLRKCIVGVIFAATSVMAAEPVDVEYGKILFQHQMYAGQIVRFSAPLSGGLGKHPRAPAYLYIDSNPQLQPLLNDKMIEKWYAEKFDRKKYKSVKITGRVQSQLFGAKVLIDVINIEEER